MKTKDKNRGFTMIELLIGIAIITVLGTVTFIAVDPPRRLAESRNSTRWLETKSILDAVLTYVADNNAFPPGIDTTFRMLGTAPSGCKQPCGEGAGSVSFTDDSKADFDQEVKIYNNTQWDDTNNWMELSPGTAPFSASGDYTSRIINGNYVSSWDTISWLPQRPYLKELPDSKGSDDAEAYPGGGTVDMTGNVLLMHMNEASGTIADSSGEGNNGTNHGAAYGAEGKFNTALSFNPPGTTSDYMEVSDDASLDITGAITLEAWAKDPPAWLSGYSRRKKITIGGVSGAGAGYPVKLTVGESSGALNLGGEALNFPNDIRFTAADGLTELNHLMAGVSGGVATFWVKVDEDLGTDQDIYIYYRKAGGTSASQAWYNLNHLGIDTGVFDYEPAGGEDIPYKYYSDSMQSGLGISSRGYHTCVLKTNGNVDCWGDDTYGQSDGEMGGVNDDYDDGDAVAVATGGFHTCVLKSNHQVNCWGDNTDLQSDHNVNDIDYTPIDAIAVSAGGYHTCVLKTDGNVDCWGDDSYGQSDGEMSGPIDDYDSVEDVIAVAAGGYHTCVLKKNGNVDCWGEDFDGQIDNGKYQDDYDEGDAIGVAVGEFHTCVLTSGGLVGCIGDDSHNQTIPGVDYDDGDAVAVSAGGYHTCVLKSNGQVNCWGDNTYNNQSDHDINAIDYDKSDAVGVSAGVYHTCVLKADGKVDCWGDTQYGQSNGEIGEDTFDYNTGDAKNPFRPYASSELGVSGVADAEILENQNKIIIDKGTDAYSLQLDSDGDTLYGYISGNEVNYTPISNPTGWHHFAMTFDGTDQKLYVDGAKVAEESPGGSIATNANNLSIGTLFTGNIDEVAIYNRALSATEIEDHYNRGALRLKIQVKSCDDDACAGETFSGPDGTSATYYTEESNGTTGTPAINLNVSENQYFQYKIFLETDDTGLSPELKSLTVDYLGGIGNYTAEACLNLTDYLTKTYLLSIPQDPKYGSEGTTYYGIKKMNNNRVRVQACGAEQSEIIENTR